jgi:3-phenylpropionate/trans-cinnamate dioxygenase ferredoxin reductase component
MEREQAVARYRYLIIGGGMTGDAAAKAIRERDGDGSIAVVGEEQHPPYARPPLSKALWKGKEEDSIWRGTEEHGVALKLGRRIVSLDPDAHTATDDRGEAYEYERALLATGGRPRKLANAPDDVVYFRTLDDYRRLRERTADGGSAVVIGGGFIGSEIAAALAANGAKVTLVFPDQGIGARLFPAHLASFLNDYYREQGVEVLPGETVEAVAHENGGFTVTTGGGRTLGADIVVAGLGIEPRADLAEAAGLQVDNGIVVDDRGRVAGRDDLFAAGDVARFPASALDTELRVEHEDHAKSHGKQVGANMAGADEPYEHLPFFYSDLFDLGYEAVGEVDSRLRTVEAWAEPNRKGVVAYVDDDGRPRGFLLWDVWGKVDDATALIRAGEPVDEAKLKELLG